MNLGKERSKGFTLIELLMVIVLMGIVSATAVMVIGNIIGQQSFDATVKEMSGLQAATIGNPDLIQNGVRSSFGYVGDMGPLPPTTGVCPACGLIELVAQGARPAWVADVQLPGTGYGWRGPYIDNKQDDVLPVPNYLALLDGWGNPYSYNSATGVITSNGPDGAVGGGDDIAWPGAAITTTGIITGRVTDKNGYSVVNNNVTVTYPNPASPGNSTTTIDATDADGVFTLLNIPIGKHKIQTTVSTLYTTTVTVLPSQTVIVDFNAAGDPTTPNAPTVVLATRASLSHINLTWTPPTLNTDATTLVDLGTYNIYRSTDAGVTYPLRQSVGLGTVFSDTTLTAGQRYIYRMTAVDKSGNPSANSAVSSTTVSPIGQTVAAVWSPPANNAACLTTNNVPNCGTAANRRKALFTINNSGNAADNGANITINSMVITWAGSGGSVKKIQAPDVTAPNRYCTIAAAGTASAATTTLTSPIIINAGTSSTMSIYFCTTGAQPTIASIQFNTSDGSFTLY